MHASGLLARCIAHMLLLTSTHAAASDPAVFVGAAVVCGVADVEASCSCVAVTRTPALATTAPVCPNATTSKEYVCGSLNTPRGATELRGVDATTSVPEGRIWKGNSRALFKMPYVNEAPLPPPIAATFRKGVPTTAVLGTVALYSLFVNVDGAGGRPVVVGAAPTTEIRTPALATTAPARIATTSKE